MKCLGCNSALRELDCVKCNTCASVFCYKCLNIVLGDGDKPSKEHLAALSCPNCQNITRRRRNDSTPCSPQVHTSQQPQLDCSLSLMLDNSPIANSAMKISSGVNSTDKPVSLDSISKLLDEKLSPDSLFMSNLRSMLHLEIEKQVKSEVKQMFTHLKRDFTATTDFIVAEQKDIKVDIVNETKRISSLESELTKSQGDLLKLQSRLFTIENISRALNIEIHEVPENKNEDLQMLFKKLLIYLLTYLKN